MKLKELKLGQIIEIANKYNGKCPKCPLYNVDLLPCFKFCDQTRSGQIIIEESLEQEIDYEQH